MRRPAPSRAEFAAANPAGGRPPKHGSEFVFGDPTTWGQEQAVTVTDTRRYGKATAQAWDRLHPRLTQRAAWLDHDGPLPVIEGTVIRLAVEHLPSGGVNKPVWLWWSRTGATEADVDRCWQAFLRRFDIEHTFRLFKQTLGWTKPRLRSSEAADRWTWLMIAAYTQLRLARPLATDLHRPWEKPAPPHKLTPARVRRGFRNLRTTTGSPAGAPKPATPGPGRPPGSKNRRPVARHDVGRVLAGGEPYQRPTHHKGRHQTPANWLNNKLTPEQVHRAFAHLMALEAGGGRRRRRPRGSRPRAAVPHAAAHRGPGPARHHGAG
jgi:hypothetical protein